MKKIGYALILLFSMLFILNSCDFGLDYNTTETDKQYEIFLLAKTAGYEGTYEEWLASIKGEKGDPGKDGVGVLSVEKTSTDGLVDTYTITLSNGEKTTFTVTNGKDGVDGVGIEKVEYDENDNLLIYFTDGKSCVVTLPKHNHIFGEWISFKSDDSYCESRLSYRICDSCNDIE